MATSVPPPPSGGSTNLGLAPNVGGLLCYVPCCIGLIFSIVVAIVEKQSRFLRFHAFQSLLFHAVLIVLSVAVQVLTMVLSQLAGLLGLLGSLFGLLVGLGALIASVLLMIKAYNNEQYELPTIGQMAKNWV
jgi:uncharacterized membrane protein